MYEFNEVHGEIIVNVRKNNYKEVADAVKDFTKTLHGSLLHAIKFGEYVPKGEFAHVIPLIKGVPVILDDQNEIPVKSNDQVLVAPSPSQGDVYFVKGGRYVTLFRTPDGVSFADHFRQIQSSCPLALSVFHIVSVSNPGEYIANIFAENKDQCVKQSPKWIRLGKFDQPLDVIKGQS